jgi:deazaflavin-dependent oxidoreductase (nitroreductase family)
MNSNSFITWVLRSPMHGLLSGGMMLITVTGRKTGRLITTPVQYLTEGDVLWVNSTRQRTWWRNLRGGAQVTLRLRGKDVHGRAEVIEEAQAVEKGFNVYFHLAPKSARLYNVKLDAAGNPDAGDIASLSQKRLLIQICPGG